MRTLSRVAALGVLVSGRALMAQDVGSISISVREPAEISLGIPDLTTRLKEAAPKNQYTFAPNFAAGSGVSIYGASFSWIRKEKNPFQLNAAVKTIDAVAADTKTRVLVDLKVELRNNPTGGKLSAVAMYQSTADAFTRKDFKLAFEHPLQAVTFGVTGSYSFIQPEVGEDRDGATVAAGVAWKPNDVGRIGADYLFKSDLDGEDRFSIVLAQTITLIKQKPALIATIGKHRVVALSLLIPITF